MHYKKLKKKEKKILFTIHSFKFKYVSKFVPTRTLWLTVRVTTSSTNLREKADCKQSTLFRFETFIKNCFSALSFRGDASARVTRKYSRFARTKNS